MCLEPGRNSLVGNPLSSTARAMADEFNLPFYPDLAEARSLHPFVLILGADGLSLRQFGDNAPGPLSVQFVSGKQAWRQRQGGGKRQLIARALGLHKGANPQVLDATAGMGGDAYVLAGLGCRVTMIEQSSVVAALLRDGLQRLAAAPEPELQAIAARMNLLPPMAAQCWLEAGNRAEIIYLDPMFPGAVGNAAVKKEMQILRQLLEPPADEAALLQSALEGADFRVVVKRHKQSPPIDGPVASYQLTGKSTRYDIYSLKKYY